MEIDRPRCYTVKAAINIIIDVVAMSRLEIDLAYLEIAILNT